MLISLILIFLSISIPINYLKKKQVINFVFCFVIVTNYAIPLAYDSFYGFDGRLALFLSERPGEYTLSSTVYVMTTLVLMLVHSMLIKRSSFKITPLIDEIMVKRVSVLTNLGVVVMILSALFKIQLGKFVIYSFSVLSALLPGFKIYAALLGSLNILSFNYSRSIVIPIALYFIVKFLIGQKKNIDLSTIAKLFLLGFVSLLMFNAMIYMRTPDSSFLGFWKSINLEYLILSAVKSNTGYQFMNEVFFMNDINPVPFYESIKHIFYSLNILPSSFIDYDFNQYSVGVFYGIDPNTLGLPTPMFLELIYFFDFSFFFLILTFLLFNQFWDNSLSKVNLNYFIGIIALLFSVMLVYMFIIGAHSSLRGSVRYAELYLIIYIVYRFLSYVAPTRSIRFKG